MGTYTTGIPLITRNIQPPPYPPVQITINKVVLSGEGDAIETDEGIFHVNITSDNGFSVVGVPLSYIAPLTFSGLQYGTYTVTEDSQLNYLPISITPSTFTLSAVNPQQNVEIINQLDLGTVTVYKEIPGAGIEYGALYNWYSVVSDKNIANTGFKVPSDIEFTTLSNYIGGTLISGGKLKETGYTHWNSPNTGATNLYNFNLRGGGKRAPDGAFGNIKVDTRLWTSYDGHPTLGFQFSVLYDATTGGIVNSLKEYGYSVRLMKVTPSASDLLKADGDSCDPYLGNDGKYYRTIKIGTQVWVAENLCETKYSTGEDITIVTGDAAWTALATEGMCYYENDANNGFINDETYFNIVITGQGVGTDSPIEQTGQVRVGEPLVFYDLPFDEYVITEEATEGYTLTSITPDTITIDAENREFDVVIVNELIPVIETIKYGALYNWYDIANVARNGFEVPEKSDFDTLYNYIETASAPDYIYVSGQKLKESGLTYWASPNTGSTNKLNFNGRGGGYRKFDTGDFLGLLSNGYFWTRTQNTSTNAYFRVISYNSNLLAGGYFGKKYGFSVRLIKISPSIEDLAKLDGEACDPYFDGEYYYRTVKIGTQVWVADNIKTRYYSDGSPIPEVTDNTAWAALTTGAMCYYDNDINNA